MGFKGLKSICPSIQSHYFEVHYIKKYVCNDTLFMKFPLFYKRLEEERKDKRKDYDTMNKPSSEQQFCK